MAQLRLLLVFLVCTVLGLGLASTGDDDHTTRVLFLILSVVGTLIWGWLLVSNHDFIVEIRRSLLVNSLLLGFHVPHVPDELLKKAEELRSDFSENDNKNLLQTRKVILRFHSNAINRQREGYVWVVASVLLSAWQMSRFL